MLSNRLQVILLLLFFHHIGFAQAPPSRVIKLDNPSFEGNPKASTPLISGWIDCGTKKFPRESPPDLQPGWFQVTTPPKEGNSYLGMVSRDNDTNESVAQLLRKPLKANQCYSFSLHLLKSPIYNSGPRTEGIAFLEAQAKGETLRSIDHTTPIILKIWGSGVNQCEMTELIAETKAVKNEQWEKYEFRFEPKTDLNFIMLEAANTASTFFTPNGHILIDDLSDIVAIPCNMEPPVVTFMTPKKSAKTEESKYQVKATLKNVFDKEDITMMLNNQKYTDFKFNRNSGSLIANVPLKNGANKLTIIGKNDEGEDKSSVSIRQNKKEEIIAEAPSPVREAPVITKDVAESTLEGVKREDLKKDLKLKIKNISFKLDSSEIEKRYEFGLKNIAKFLIDNRDIIIEIGGHTNNRCGDIVCNQLSEDRANSVLEFLVENGVDRNQLRSKGYGKTQPVTKITSNVAQRRNQRVEMKILEISG